MKNTTIARRKKRHVQKNIKNIFPRAPRILFHLLFVSFICVTGYILLYSSFVQVYYVHIDGVQDPLKYSIHNTTQEFLSKTRPFGIKERNIFFLSVDNLERTLQEQFTRIEEVSAQKIFPQQIHITVKERDRIVVLCANGVSNETCVVVDDAGRVESHVDFQLPLFTENHVILFETNGDLEKEIGRATVTEDVLQRALYLVEELPFTLGIHGQAPYTFISLGSSELQFATDEGWTLFVDMMHDPDVTIKILSTFFAQVEEVGARDQLEIVDVRLVDKVFYKMKDQPEDAEISDEGIIEESEASEDTVE